MPDDFFPMTITCIVKRTNKNTVFVKAKSWFSCKPASYCFILLQSLFPPQLAQMSKVQVIFLRKCQVEKEKKKGVC